MLGERDIRGPCRGLLGLLGLGGFGVRQIRAWTRLHSQEWLCYWWALSSMSGWNGRLGIAPPLCRFVRLRVYPANNLPGRRRLVLRLAELLMCPFAPGNCTPGAGWCLNFGSDLQAYARAKAHTFSRLHIGALQRSRPITKRFSAGHFSASPPRLQDWRWNPISNRNRYHAIPHLLRLPKIHGSQR